jgi:hypothetical protein
VFSIGGLEPDAARARARVGLPEADPEDLLLLDDLLGIADPGVSVARRPSRCAHAPVDVFVRCSRGRSNISGDFRDR